MKETVAAGKLRLAIDRMAVKYPLHAGILAGWVVEATTAFPTMAVGFDSINQRLRLYYSQAFVEKISLEHLGGVLHHEVNHVLFEHVFHIPEPGEDRAAMTVAQEVTVNEWVPEPLPLKPILLSDYPFLKPDEDTETRYRQLIGKVKDEFPVMRIPAVDGADRGGKGDLDDPQGNGDSGKGQKDGAPAGEADAGAGGGPEQGALDRHASWAEIQGNLDAAKAVSDCDIERVWLSLPSDQRKKVPEAVKVAIDEPCHGTCTCTDASKSDLNLGKARVQWQTVLRPYVGRAVMRGPTFGRPPRRCPNLVGIVPGKARRQPLPRVMAAIDTSPSLTDAMLADISAELSRMSRCYPVTVVECDLMIRAVYPYTKPIRSVHGRCGTDLRPPFDPEFLRSQKADVVVYFTDGDGPAPEKAPPVPVIWCLTKGGANKAGWGREVWMKD